MSFSLFFTFVMSLLLFRSIKREKKWADKYACVYRHNLIADHSADHSYYTYVISDSYFILFFVFSEETAN